MTPMPSGAAISSKGSETADGAHGSGSTNASMSQDAFLNQMLEEKKAAASVNSKGTVDAHGARGSSGLADRQPPDHKREVRNKAARVSTS